MENRECSIGFLHGKGKLRLATRLDPSVPSSCCSLRMTSLRWMYPDPAAGAVVLMRQVPVPVPKHPKDEVGIRAFTAAQQLGDSSKPSH